MGILIRMQETTRDLGLALHLTCPRCEVPTEFRVIESKSKFSVLFIPFPAEIDGRLSCSKCGYTSLLERSDLQKLEDLGEQCANEDLTEEEVHELVNELKIGAVRETRVLADTWHCEECDEDVPSTFSHCWKCGANAPDDTLILDVEESSVIGGHHDPIQRSQAPQIRSKD